MRKLKHSKIRNTGLLFEFLLRQITADLLDKSKTNGSAVDIIKSKFNERTELGKELALYNLLTTTKFKSDKKAEYCINEILRHRQNLNNSALKREKYNLIKQLRETYDLQNFLSSKVKNYKIYASIYKLFEFSETLSPDAKTEAHFNLVEHITTNEKHINISETIGGSQIPFDRDLNIITYKTLLEKFNKKYVSLNISQKKLLKSYINNVSNTNSLKEYIQIEIPKIKKGLKAYSKNLKDEVVKIKLKEAIKSIEKFCDTGNNKVVNDNVVVQTMRYLELLKELKKSGSKNKKVI
tara:strand:- start:730 stop:1614 length:885 start_codon:yes stop_codon:yes gene_type:complete